MPRRSYASRRLSLESLEVRCNPAALVPLADYSADPAPPDPQSTPLGSIVDLEVDPRNRDKPVGQQNLPNVPAYSIVIDRRPSLAQDKPVNLNSFAGQTVNILVEAADASTASRAAGGFGNDVLLGGAGQDAIEQTGILRHELGHTLGLRHEHTRPASNSPATGDVNGDGFDDIITGSTVSGHVKVLDETIGSDALTSPASDSSTVSGRVTAVVVDPSDPVTVYIGTGQDQRNGGAPSGKLYLATNLGVFVSIDGRDVLLGGAGENLLIGGST